MKLTPKILLGVLAILFFISIIFFLNLLNPRKTNSLTINSNINEFKGSFDIDKKKTPELEKFLENLDIPYQVENGFSFKLDATTSEYLDLLTPIKTDLDISPRAISFRGKSIRSVFLEGLTIDPINIPQDTNLAVFAPDLSTFITSRLSFTPEEKNIFENSVKNNSGHYLLIFGSGKSFGLIFKKDDFNFNNLKEVPQEASVSAGKKEDQNKTTKFYLLSSGTDDKNSDTGVFFDLGTYKVFASSIDAANQIIDSQNSPQTTFPKSKEDNASFTLDFKNYDNQDLSDDFIKLAFYKGIGITGGKEKIKSSLSKVKEMSVTLKGDTFSGLISTE